MQTYLSYTVSRVSNGPFIPVISWPEGGIAQHCTVVVASDSGAYTCQSRAEHAAMRRFQLNAETCPPARLGGVPLSLRLQYLDLPE